MLLPKLEVLELSTLTNNSISLILDEQLLDKSFNNLKTLTVDSCDFIKSLPLPVLKSLNKLDKLKVRLCDKLEKVFGHEDLNDYYKERESSSEAIVPLNIKHLTVVGCNGLTTLMTSSSARSLVHLTHLSISNCLEMEEIILKQEGENGEDKEIVFSKLEFLELSGLRSLKRFCSHKYTFRFLFLECVTISECPQLTVFCSGAIHTPRLQSIQLDYLVI